MKRINFFFGLSFYCVFETVDLRSYRGYYLAICQLCFNFSGKAIVNPSKSKFAAIKLVVSVFF